MADDDDVPLQPPEGWDERERVARTRHYSAPLEPDRPQQLAGQFQLRDIFLATFFVALGLAGGSWMSRGNYAGILGLAFVFSLGLVSVLHITSRWAIFSVCGLGAAYAAAVLMALLE